MRGRFQHAGHVKRVAAVFLVATVAFLIARRELIPADFGTLGFYRAGAIDEARIRPIAYAGNASCVDCHRGKYENELADPAPPPADPVSDNRHFVLRCESCHGPLARHAITQKKRDAGEDVPDSPVPLVISDKLCLGCHLEITARPAFQPQVLVGDHGDNDKCASCHRPHRPRTDEDDEG